MNRKLCYCLAICAVVATWTTVSGADNDLRKLQTASLVRTLGYGGAIHNFKNYVLRGDKKYSDAATRMFARANQLLAELSKADGLTADQSEAVATIRETVKQYQAHLPTVERLHKQGKSVEAIDESVIVDDSAAIDAIATLREGHEWSKIEDLEFHIGYGSGIHNFKNFVLRADEKYRAQASLGLSKVLLIVARYRDSSGLTQAQIKALDAIESVVRSYEESLHKVRELIGEGKTAREIDALVKVDDGPALQGLATLRE